MATLYETKPVGVYWAGFVRSSRLGVGVAGGPGGEGLVALG